MPAQALIDRLIESIYQAALQPSGWDELARELSEALRGSAVLVSVFPPGAPAPEFHTVGFLEGYPESQSEHMVRGLPYSSSMASHFDDCWASMGDVFPDLDLSRTEFYREWMKPQKLAPIWPVGCGILVNDLNVGGIGVFRARGGRPFSDDEMELGEQLVPHLSRAMAFHATLEGVQRERLALSQVVDRLPMGVILLDASRKPVVTNQSADRIVEQADGFKIGPNGPYAESARENATLHKLLADALEARSGHELEASCIMAISRPSGRRDYPVMVTPLLSAPPGSSGRNLVVALFISDVEAGPVEGTSDVLETLYSLTHSEAELVRLLSEGHSLEQAADARGVTMNTARSHLKHVFAKTQTNRQGELVRLVLTGVAALRER